MVRSVTRQIESEWDDTNRALVEGMSLHDQEAHSEGCGLHPAILAEPDLYRFTYAEDSCPACTSRDVYLRELADRDQKWVAAHEKFPMRIARPSDGRRISLVPIKPTEPDEGR